MRDTVSVLGGAYVIVAIAANANSWSRSWSQMVNLKRQPKSIKRDSVIAAGGSNPIGIKGSICVRLKLLCDHEKNPLMNTRCSTHPLNLNKLRLSATRENVLVLLYPDRTPASGNPSSRKSPA